MNWFFIQGRKTSSHHLPGTPSIGQADTGNWDWFRHEAKAAEDCRTTRRGRDC